MEKSDILANRIIYGLAESYMFNNTLMSVG